MMALVSKTNNEVYLVQPLWGCSEYLFFWQKKSLGENENESPYGAMYFASV